MDDMHLFSETDVIERLKSRSVDQLKVDAVEIDKKIQLQKSEIETIQSTLLDKIIMINMKDLSKIENDATEDRQKLFTQFARSDNDGLFGPL